LFRHKIGSVVLVGAVNTVSSHSISSEQQNHPSLDQRHQDQKYRPLIPKDCSSNKFDMTAASFFYEHCQLLGVPLTVVDDEVRFRDTTKFACLISKSPGLQ